MGGVTTKAWRARLRAVLSVDVIAKLKAVKVPLLYLQAKGDRVVSQSAWHHIKRSLPEARLAELDGPHFLLQAKPVESAARITAFARELGFAL
jgi:pimeloyl-ACP methyl ester carboxylesterase